MSYWDSSALVKLYVQELDSTEFRELAVNANRVATGSLTRHEVRTVFRRREAEGVLPSGEAAALYDELTADIAAADIVIQPETADMEREFGTVLEACFSQKPPTFIRTNDALHLASAKVAGELEFITAEFSVRLHFADIRGRERHGERLSKRVGHLLFGRPVLMHIKA